MKPRSFWHHHPYPWDDMNPTLEMASFPNAKDNSQRKLPRLQPQTTTSIQQVSEKIRQPCTMTASWSFCTMYSTS